MESHLHKEEKKSMKLNKKVLTIREDGDILDAILLMIKNNIGRLIVVDDEGKMIGIVTRMDLLRKIAGL